VTNGKITGSHLLLRSIKPWQPQLTTRPHRRAAFDLAKRSPNMNLPEYLITNHSALAQRIVENGGCPLWPDLDGFAEYLDANDLYTTSEDPEFEKAMQLFDAWIAARDHESREDDLKLFASLRAANVRGAFTVDTVDGISRLAWVVENEPIVYGVEGCEGDATKLLHIAVGLNAKMGLSADDVTAIFMSASVAPADCSALS
jgi:hypothetical protein